MAALAGWKPKESGGLFASDAQLDPAMYANAPQALASIGGVQGSAEGFKYGLFEPAKPGGPAANA
jgi:hypothetical protein